MEKKSILVHGQNLKHETKKKLKIIMLSLKCDWKVNTFY
jgi:hypothetical protein